METEKVVDAGNEISKFKEDVPKSALERVGAIIGIVASIATIGSFLLALADLVTVATTVIGFTLGLAVLGWIGVGIGKLTTAVKEVRNIKQTMINIHQGRQSQAVVQNGKGNVGAVGNSEAIGGNKVTTHGESVADRLRKLHRLYEAEDIPNAAYQKKLEELLKEL